MSHILILCGDSDSRIHLISNKKSPKQFIEFIKKQNESFQQTISKIEKLNRDSIIIICDKKHYCTGEQHLADIRVNVDKSDIVILDVDNLSIVDNKDQDQSVKNIVDEIEKIMDNPNKVYRPWGWFETISGDDYSGYKVKKICVYPNKRLSLQSHKYRSEHWVIVNGMGHVRLGNNDLVVTKDQHILIPTNTLHRIDNRQNENLYFIETQIGSYLGEDDIRRYEDDFGRV